MGSPSKKWDARSLMERLWTRALEYWSPGERRRPRTPLPFSRHQRTASPAATGRTQFDPWGECWWASTEVFDNGWARKPLIVHSPDFVKATRARIGRTSRISCSVVDDSLKSMASEAETTRRFESYP